MPYKAKMRNHEEEIKRTPNWEFRETTLLLEEVCENREIIFSAHTVATTNKRKEQVWQGIADKISNVGVATRTAVKCREKFSILKSAFHKQRKHATGTGGGDPKKYLPDDIYDLVLECIEGKPIGVESDVLPCRPITQADDIAVRATHTFLNYLANVKKTKVAAIAPKAPQTASFLHAGESDMQMIEEDDVASGPSHTIHSSFPQQWDAIPDGITTDPQSTLVASKPQHADISLPSTLDESTLQLPAVIPLSPQTTTLGIAAAPHSTPVTSASSQPADIPSTSQTTDSVYKQRVSGRKATANQAARNLMRKLVYGRHSRKAGTASSSSQETEDLIEDFLKIQNRKAEAEIFLLERQKELLEAKNDAEMSIFATKKAQALLDLEKSQLDVIKTKMEIEVLKKTLKLTDEEVLNIR